MTSEGVYSALYEKIETLVKEANTPDELASLAHAFAAVQNTNRP